jgi:hypothetical protein
MSRSFLSKLVHHRTYASYLPEEKRRESIAETVDRNAAMHIRRFPHLKDEIVLAYEQVHLKRAVPSMRSFQFAGEAIERRHNRMYNCSFVNIESIEDLADLFYMSMSGCFHPDTLVSTKDGPKAIKDITTNDEVLTYNEINKTYEYLHPQLIHENPTEKTEKLELTFADGSTVKCTPDHRFLTRNRGWVEAKDLTEDDDVEHTDIKNSKV